MEDDRNFAECQNGFWEEMDNVISNSLNNLCLCVDATHVLHSLDAHLFSNLEKSPIPGHSSIFALEDSLLQLAAGDEVDGCFYCIVFKAPSGENERFFARFFEHGCFEGAFWHCKELLENQTKEEVLGIRVFSNFDVTDTKMRQDLLSKKKASSASEKRSSYVRHLRSNKTSVVNASTYLLPEMEANKIFKDIGVVVFVERKNSKKNKKDDRLLICQGISKKPEEWEAALLKYKMSRGFENAEKIAFFDSIQSPAIDLQTQLKYISEIPNSPKWLWSLGDPAKQQIKFEQRFSNSVNYPPASPRNRVIKTIAEGGSLSLVEKAIRVMVNIYDDPADLPDINEPPKKRRFVEKRTRPSINVKTICESFGIDEHEAATLSKNVSTSYEKQSLYIYFVEKLFSNGCLNWRVKTPSLQVVLLNDYDSETGEFKENDFVHVSVRESTQGEDPVITCTCQLFGLLENSLEDTCEFGWEGISCCHARLLKDILKVRTAENMQYSENSPSIPREYFNNELLDRAEKHLEHPVIQMPSKNNVHKFSIVDGSDAELITIYGLSKNRQKIVTCHSSYCQSQCTKTRTVESFLTSETLCNHLLKLRSAVDVSQLNFSFDNLDAEDHIATEENEELGTENTTTMDGSEWEKIFDEDSGKWKLHAESKSKLVVPGDPFSLKLKNDLRLRTSQFLQEQTIDFIPGKEGNCNCENVWYNDKEPNGVVAFDTKTLLYTTVGAVEARVFKRKCMGGTCVRVYDGIEDSVYRSTNAVCCGYEVGWEFVDQVMASKQTFSGFIKCIQNRYERMASPIRFMSINTFIKWWFSWASAMEIDFRTPCFGCGDEIKMLACDGTKIGITWKHANIIPIEEKQDGVELVTPNRVYDRTFINNKECLINNKECPKTRKQFNSIINKLCKHKLGVEKLVDDDVLKLIGGLQGITPALLTAVKYLFLGKNDTEITLLAKFLAILTGEKASLVNIFPTKYLPILEKLSILVEATTVINNDSELWNFKDVVSKSSKFFFPEFGDWVNHSIVINHDSPPTEVMKGLIAYIWKYRKMIQSEVVLEEAPSIVRKYNPPKYGRAYYFTSDGSQLRIPRRFTIDRDDKEESEHTCSKIYPTVSRKGTTYLFLWFCPCHGHCYGFHMIPKSEGRKDAAHSIYSYLKKAPEYVFYDFACSFEEFCRNRESGFFNNTSFFHDIFHGFAHKCSQTFKSNRLLGFNGVNTSICEQFNSFLQCIKASSKLMTQEHFTFYTQFFIHQWNTARKISFKKKASVAIAGNQ